MGYNTRDAFRELSSIIDEIFGIIQNFALTQIAINTTTATALASSGIFPPHGVSAGVIGGANTAGLPSQVLNPLYHARLNKLFDFEINYLFPFGYKFICSRSVKTT